MGAFPRRVCQRVLSFVVGVGVSSVPLRVPVVLASKGGRQTRPLAWKGQGMMMPHCVPPPLGGLHKASRRRGRDRGCCRYSCGTIFTDRTLLSTYIL